ncbi:hypothetical protein IGI42_001779 [Enterococcus sp. AZ109]
MRSNISALTVDLKLAVLTEEEYNSIEQNKKGSVITFRPSGFSR